MASFKSIRLRTHLTKSMLESQIASNGNVNIQRVAAEKVRDGILAEVVYDLYYDTIATVRELLIDPSNSLDGGSTFIGSRTSNGGRTVKGFRWKHLEKGYYKYTKNKAFFHHRGNLSRKAGGLFPLPSRNAIRKVDYITVSKYKNSRVKADIRVYLNHKLGSIALTRYVDEAFAKGVIHPEFFKHSKDKATGALVMIEAGRKGTRVDGGGYARTTITKRSIIAPVAISLGGRIKKEVGGFKHR